jgi:hypothetical protein
VKFLAGIAKNEKLELELVISLAVVAVPPDLRVKQSTEVHSDRKNYSLGLILKEKGSYLRD